MRRRNWRDGWDASVAAPSGTARQLSPERMLREYPSVAAYQHDAAMLAKDGWQVASVADRHRDPGFLRVAARFWLRVRRRPQPAVVVAYRRLH